ncbi:cyanidin-3-O-glucoside 2-O-glucuronosyltransferase-like [Phalaenopsis equestris]|uniref:cyanidin-3-O-glucoside 2-O-glucuronosyltransferase-like n=1 Tax=Phalaenopsis equestris TaxID=78828 RepID=UPI0009E44A7F|nr:cyanidin-3-O-glucoside 2-O-glucuronosyltransferase-like [Phalaenopsis equestris]
MAAVQPNQPPLRIVMLPWLAHGHISPFLELAKKLSTNPNISIYLCSTPANLKSLNLNSDSFPRIHLTELHLPSDHLPPHLHTTKNLPSHLMPILKASFDQYSPFFSRLLVSLSPHLLIYDFVLPWAPLAASRLHVPAILFLALSSSASAFFVHSLLRPPHEQFPFLANPNKSDFADLLDEESNGSTAGERFIQCINNSTEFIAVRSFSEIEARYIEYLSSLVGKEVIPVGPLVSAVFESEGREELEWLGSKEKGTVVFVSVGTEYFMTESEMEELAIGLNLCGLFSIWVVRFNGGDGDRGRPMGFSWDRGLVVEGWAPQKNILAHPSVGGFVTHCGWSSVIEGMRHGVPMIAIPLQLDQPLNAALMVELGVAVKVKKEEGGGVFRGEELARCIREVVVGEEGEGVRRRAKEMARIMMGKDDEEIEVLRERIEGFAMGAESAEGKVPIN